MFFSDAIYGQNIAKYMANGVESMRSCPSQTLTNDHRTSLMVAERYSIKSECF